MCGIAGWIGNIGGGESTARAIAARLSHRGPDGVGVRVFDRAALIHARLAILDLSVTGDQPLAEESGKIWTIVNGELYNHHPIRTRLEQSGHHFRGRSDCEIVPHLYEERRSAFVEELRGMFALAVYDERERSMVLARDRFGIKPLFYTASEHGLVFASEIRALRWLPGVDTSVDTQALWDYSALMFVPAPRTFFRGIRALEPGQYLEASMRGDRLQYDVRRYHQWSVRPDRTLTAESAARTAAGLLDRAVASQLESDVPLGSLLSGGIDSSLVSAAAQAALPAATLRTFNVQFPDAQYDETWAAQAVAKAIGSAHETLPFAEGAGTWDTVRTILTHAGQPFADSSVMAADAVSELMRRHVTVALSGDGGDEGFGGYDIYWQLGAVPPLAMLPRPLRRLGAAVAGKLKGAAPRLYRWGRRLDEIDWRDDATVLHYLTSWVRDAEQKQLLPDVVAEPVRRLYEPQWQDPASYARLPRLERLSALATEVRARVTMPNDYLFKVDIASMRHALEIRVPLLDEDLFAFGLTLPHRLKVQGRTSKRVLRDVARARLPKEVAEKKKWGFGVPTDRWVEAGFRGTLREELLGSGSPVHDYFDRGEVRRIVETFCSPSLPPDVSRSGLHQRLFMLLGVHFVMDDLRTSSEIPAARVVGA